MYDVQGANAKAGLQDTTWTQKNKTHHNQRIRRIFRFEKSTVEFQKILKKNMLLENNYYNKLEESKGP